MSQLERLRYSPAGELLSELFLGVALASKAFFYIKQSNEHLSFLLVLLRHSMVAEEGILES